MSEDASEQAVDAHKAVSGRKPYQRPVLVRMGALREVTMQKGSGKTSDGGKFYYRYTGRGGLHVSADLSGCCKQA